MLNANLNVKNLSRSFQDQHRVLIENVLNPEFAEQIRVQLDQWTEWNLVTRVQGQHRACLYVGIASLSSCAKLSAKRRLAIQTCS